MLWQTIQTSHNDYSHYYVDATFSGFVVTVISQRNSKGYILVIWSSTPELYSNNNENVDTHNIHN